MRLSLVHLLLLLLLVLLPHVAVVPVSAATAPVLPGPGITGTVTPATVPVAAPCPVLVHTHLR